MSRHRHDEANRAATSRLPVEIQERIEWYRQRATRRKLVLLECGIIRHPPFADCGRPLWALMMDQPWFEVMVPSAEWLRIWRESGRPYAAIAAELPTNKSAINGHQALEDWEDEAIAGTDSDAFVRAEEYFRRAEYEAEADRFETPEEQRDELEIRYGAAYWLQSLRGLDAGSWNILDYYLGDFPGAFYRWAGWRPFHTDHHRVALALIEDILGCPESTFFFKARWRTPNVVALATTMDVSRDFTPMPILADALEEAGCDNADMLAHCRADRLHTRGCWVVDSILERK